MHSHVPVQEMNLLAAPLIVRRPEDLTADRQEITMFLHDFSFRPAEEVLAEIAGAQAESGTSGMGGMAGMDHSKMAMGGTGGGMDLNDFEFDAYLANDRTLSDPEVIRVDRDKPGGCGCAS